MDLILQQMQYFLASFLWGVLLFFLYDLLRIFRKLIHHGLAAVLLEDIIFWVISSVFVFRMVFEENNGTLRLFFILAFVGGMYAYFLLAGNRFSSWIAKWIHNILWPIGRGVKKVMRNVKNLLKKCGKHLIMKTRGKLQR
ncbi:MAG: spore cortex biosynthesis protein YabQ [Lachnospiraceae bacterium]|nr:spore cortex biosynthesis protein YabQ [Lachnospiraceae bacterium]